MAIRVAIVMNGAVVERRTLDALPVLPPEKAGIVRPLIEVMPVYDPTLEVLMGPVTVIAVDKVTDTYTSRPKTDAERGPLLFENAIKAVVMWCAQKFGVAPATARGEILAIFRSL